MSAPRVRFCINVAMALLAVASPTTAFAQDLTWDGSDADWSTDASWLPGGVQPTATDNAIINTGTVSLTQTGELSNGLTVGDTGTATLNIQGGGQLSSGGAAFLGKQANSHGTVLIDGAGSRWEMDERDQDLVIGDEGTGTLTVQNGGDFEILELDQDVILGAQSGASGSITVTGPGSTWTGGGDFLVVGNYGQGTFLAEAGATVENRSIVYIGYLGGGTGEVTVTGAGTTWDITGAGFHIGSAGNGTLRVLDGAVVNSAFLGMLGVDGESGNGQVIVDGAGSSWTTGAALRLGGAGTGTVTITNGGSVAADTGGNNSQDSSIQNGSSVTVDASSLTYGEPLRITEGTLDLAAGSSFSGTDIDIGTFVSVQQPPIAEVTIDNSTWTNSDQLSVGFDGEGTLLAQNGSALISRLVVVGETADGDGDATITGVGSSWTANEQLTVGRSGIGELNVEAGATMSSPFTVVGATSNGVGQITVTGTGSSLDAGDLIAGRFSSGQATIDVEAGGTLTTQNTNMGESAGAVGTVTVSGAGSLWTNTGDLTIGILGTATVSATNGGQIQVDGLTTIGAGSTLDLNGGKLSTSTFDPSAGTFNFAGELELTGGDFTVGAAGLFGANPVLTANQTLTIPNTIVFDAGAEMTIDGGTLNTDAFDFTAGGELNFVSGTLGLTSGNFVVGNTGFFGNEVFLNSGQTLNITELATIEAGATFIVGGGFSSAGLTNSGNAIFIDANIDGPVNNPAGSNINVVGNVTFTGLVSGGGGIFGSGTADFQGGFSPGDSPAQVTIEGSATFGESNTLLIELGGTIAGSEYDVVDVAGSLTVDGILEVALIDSYTPTLGDSFDILEFGSLTGTFNTTNLPALGSGLLWDESQLYSDGVIAVISNLTGDYNGDGTVDAADYTVWRDTLGSSTLLPGDTTPGVVTQSDYEVWRANFGATLPSTNLADGAIPEPGALALALSVLGAAMARRQRT